MARFIRPLAVAMLATVTVCAGCTRSRSIWVATYERGAAELTRPAPEAGVYRVKWSVERDGRSFGVDASERIVGAGDRLGFRTEAGGRIVALAGDEAFELDGLDPAARYCVWSCKYDEASDFAQAAETITETATTASFIFGGFLFAAMVDQAGDEVSKWLDKGANPDNDRRRKERRRPNATRPPTTQAGR